ncbi:MAG: biotin synthase BioB, partial [bacterium]
MIAKVVGHSHFTRGVAFLKGGTIVQQTPGGKNQKRAQAAAPDAWRMPAVSTLKPSPVFNTDCMSTIPQEFHDILERALAAAPLSDGQIRRIIDSGPDQLPALLHMAGRVRQHFFGRTVQFCAIINAKSGRCSEDCTFCAQSVHYATDSPEYPLKDAHTILQAARRMKAAGAGRFSLVTSGKSLSARELDAAASLLQSIRNEGLEPDISPGVLDEPRLKALQAKGLSGYHHNLETSRSHFPAVCTTHDYDEDVDAVRAAVKSGLYVCSGGLFGLGETWEDRVELALLLRELGVHSVPVNFLHPIPGTPLADRPLLQPEEALKTIMLLRFLLPDRQIRICGGRETVFGSRR